MSLKHKAKSIVLLSIAALLLTIVIFNFACQRRLPTRPPDRDLNQVGQVRGTIGDNDAIMKSDVYKDPVTKESIIVSQFVDLDGINLGTAELAADNDVTSYLSSVIFNIPGQTYLDMDGHFSVEVVITESRIQQDMYEVKMTCVETRNVVTFYMDKTTSLAKGSETKADGVDIVLLINSIAGHSVMLCIGTDEVIQESLQCKEQAADYCDRRGVKSAYLQGTFSLRNGCERGCRVICRTHDQGFIGY